MEENTRNNSVNSRVGEEGEIVATCTGVDIPLQPMERNVSKQIHHILWGPTQGQGYPHGLWPIERTST